MARERRERPRQQDSRPLPAFGTISALTRHHACARARYARIGEAVGGHRSGRFAAVAERLAIPGFANAHSHAFQRALRGRTEGGDFWAWRELMLAEAERQTPELVRATYADTYREMRAAGYTAVGEFHYVGLKEAHAAVEAADEAGIAITLLHVAYARGGLERFRQASTAEYFRQVEELRERGTLVGLAPHSVRACPPGWLEEIAAYAEREHLPLTSSRVRSRNASPSTESARSSCSRRPAVSDPRRRSFTRRTPTTTSSTCSPRPERGSASARRRKQTSVTASAPSSASASAGSASASAPTRTCASTRSRSCANSKESRAAVPGDAM